MLTPIQRAMTEIREGTLDTFRQALAKHPGVLDTHGPHLLEHAATNDRFDVMAFLLGSGIDVNAATGDDTPLSAAAREGSVESILWLLDRGAEVNRRIEPTGSTPLEEAVMEGRPEVVALLLDRGADPDILHGNPGRNALASARFWGQDEVAALLEERGVAEIIVVPEPVDVESIAFLDASQPLSVAEWFDAKWPPVYAHAIRHGLGSLRERNRTLFLVGYLIDQLASGGAAFVYMNPSAEFAPEMPAALDRIGATRAAEIVRSLNALFPGGSPAADREVRMEQIGSLPPEATALGMDLENLFDEWQPGGGERALLAQLHSYWHA